MIRHIAGIHNILADYFSRHTAEDTAILSAILEDYFASRASDETVTLSAIGEEQETDTEDEDDATQPVRKQSGPIRRIATNVATKETPSRRPINASRAQAAGGRISGGTVGEANLASLRTTEPLSQLPSATMQRVAFASRTAAARVRSSGWFHVCVPTRQLAALSSSDLKNHLLGKTQLTSAANGTIKLLKALHVRKKRKDKDLILLEGHRLVIEALRGGMKPQHVLLTDRGVSAPLGKELLQELMAGLSLRIDDRGRVRVGASAPKDRDSGRDAGEDAGVESGPALEMVSEELMASALSDVEMPQGVVATFLRPTLKAARRPAGEAPLVLVLDQVSDPGNVGTALRTAHGLGVHSVVAVEGTSDVWSPKALRAAMGATLHISVVQAPWASLQAAARVGNLLSAVLPGATAAEGENLQVLVADCDPRAVSYDTIQYTRPTLLIVGSETGVSQDAQLLVDAGRAVKVFIPIARKLDSLNVGVATAIILAEAARQRRTKAYA